VRMEQGMTGPPATTCWYWPVPSGLGTGGFKRWRGDVLIRGEACAHFGLPICTVGRSLTT
jgi:hypothetical protein